MTMETAPVENPEYMEEPVAKKLTSVQTAKPNAQMYLAIAVAMVQAMMFGLDQSNFRNVQILTAKKLTSVQTDNGDRTSKECVAWPFCKSVRPTGERGIFKTPRNQVLLQVLSFSGVVAEIL